MWAKHKQQGFTIVELLIVIVVIGILAAITIVAYSGIQTRARDAVRINDIKSIQTAVELYYATNGQYPLPANGLGSWTGNCAVFGSVTGYITGIAPFSPRLPLDPRWVNTDNKCYLYISDGLNYMVLAWNSMENICGGDPSNACNSADIRALDRSCCIEQTIAVYSAGASNW